MWPLERNLLKFSVTAPTAPRVTLMNLEDPCCDVDEFCQVFLPAWLTGFWQTAPASGDAPVA